MSHKTQAQLANQLARASRKVAVGAHYIHYKDDTKLYEVLGFSIIEPGDEVAVMYRAEYGQRLTYVRPLREWNEKVNIDGHRQPRFQKIECPTSRQTE